MLQGLRGPSMDRHMEESIQQHLMLMCSLVTKQQNQITTLKNALSRISLHQSGTHSNMYALHQLKR